MKVYVNTEPAFGPVESQIYGAVEILRMQCPKDCGEWCIIHEGEIQCCYTRWKIDLAHSPLTSRKRMTGTAHKRNCSPAVTRKLVVQQGGVCAYCSNPFGMVVCYKGENVPLRAVADHVIPFAFSGDTSIKNLVAACHICNAWKTDRIFSGWKELKRYLTERWNKHVEIV